MIFGEHPLKDAWRRLVWGPGRRALQALPPGLELRLVGGGGRVAAAALAGKRAKIRANLGRALPGLGQAALDRIARQAFGAHFANQYISFSFDRCTAETWPRYLQWRGLDRLQAAWAQGRGVVLTHPHMGPAQLPLHVLGLLGWPMHQIGGGRVTAVSLSPTGQWASETRSRLEQRMPVQLHDGKRFLRPVLRALRDGEVVMTAADATGGGEELGRRLPRALFGQPWGVPVGPLKLAWTSDAALLTLCCHRSDQAGPPYVAEIGPALDLPRDQGQAAFLEAGADALIGWLEGALRAWPGDWLFWDGFEPGGLLPAQEGGR